jgi:hypothetical protein
LLGAINLSASKQAHLKPCFMQHLLKKQVIDLEIGAALDAYSIQHSISHHFWKHIYPLLEKIFDELGSGNEVIKIDRIEIDLSCITLDYIELATWPATYLQEIENKLRRALQLQLKEKKQCPEPKESAVFRQWLFYMENGHLPWNGMSLKKESTIVLESLATEYSCISALRQLLLRNPVALNRIILQHDETFLQNLVAVLTTKKQQGLIAFIDEMMCLPDVVQKPKPGTSLLPVHHARKKIWQHILRFAATKEQPALQDLVFHVLSQLITNVSVAHALATDPSLQKLSISGSINKIAAWFAELPVNESKPEKDIVQNIDMRLPNQTDDKTVQKPEQIENIDRNIISHKDETNTKNETNQIPAANHASAKTKEQSQPLNENILPKSHLIKKDQPPPQVLPASETEEPGLFNLDLSTSHDLEEGLFIGSAGLVLTHPFLPTLFKKLSWAHNGQFAGINEQHLALHLLHYMATGETTAEEYELVTAKLLCGYPLQMPVPKEIILDEAATNEANNMLEALIAQWEILKQTSIHGLREGFLQRRGKLFTKKERLYLQVETSSIDLLLDKLPWNLSIIKLPWMKDLLNVDWR